MNTTISFGQKIPLAMFQLKDTLQNRYVPAIIYEMDCKDISDIDEVMAADGYWMYRPSIINNMVDKFKTMSDEPNGKRFYVTQLENGSTLGMSQVHTNNNELCVDFIESRRDKRYKYVGQTMLAALGKNFLKKDGKRLVIPTPTDPAMPFYIDKCGFKEYKNTKLKMNKVSLQKFITRTQRLIETPIIDIEV